MDARISWYAAGIECSWHGSVSDGKLVGEFPQQRLTCPICGRSLQILPLPFWQEVLAFIESQFPGFKELNDYFATPEGHTLKPDLETTVLMWDLEHKTHLLDAFRENGNVGQSL